MQKLTYRTRRGMTDVLTGHRKDWRGRLLFAGPAVIASVAYMDPGNYATNIQAGAGYGYQLLWVVLLANLIAKGDLEKAQQPDIAWYEYYLNAFKHNPDVNTVFISKVGFLNLSFMPTGPNTPDRHIRPPC